MSIVYINERIPFPQNVSNVSYESQDTLLRTEMDFGTHVRSKGDAIIESINCNLTLSNKEFGYWLEWITIAGSTIWYAKFIDKNYPNIDPEKYYAFSFNTIVIPKSRIGNHSFSLSLELIWHFRVQPIGRESRVKYDA